jgi:hypothetical protein
LNFGDAPMLEIRMLPAVHRTVAVLRCHRWHRARVSS